MLSLRFPQLSARWPAALAAAMLWAVAVGSLLLWWLHMPRAMPLPAPVASLITSKASAQKQGALERALGHTILLAVVPDVQNRYQLLGVIASVSGKGSALIAVDGQPPKAFMRGQHVIDGWHVQQIGSQQVQLASTVGVISLEMPSKIR